MSGKTITRCLKSDKGSSLGMVIILLMLMSLMANSAMVIAKKQFMMATFNKEVQNCYYLAYSGVEKIVDSMNRDITVQIPKLMEKAFKLVNLNTFTYEDTDKEDFYLGKYISKDLNNQYQAKLNEVIYEHIIKEFAENKDKENLMDYKVYPSENKEMLVQILAKIYYKGQRGLPQEIKKIIDNLEDNKEIGQKKLVIEVMAQYKDKNNKTIAKSKVMAIIELECPVQNNEEILEEYEWITSDFSWKDKIDLSLLGNDIDWSYNNPIKITHNSQDIDILMFQEIPTAIIGTDKDVDITLEGSGVFNGLIVTPGNVYLSDKISINGVIIANNQEDIDHLIDENQEMIFKIRCMDQTLRRRLYSALNIVDYKNNNYNVKLSSLSAIKYTQDETYLKIKWIRKI